MKKVTVLFIISFTFFTLGELLWSLRLFAEESSVFADIKIDLIVNILFFLCSIFGLVGSCKWYKIESNKD
tara:strand:+ start:241 stop:450 length:210 start_codon:yes stop_codon:yes gene_type:complete